VRFAPSSTLTHLKANAGSESSLGRLIATIFLSDVTHDLPRAQEEGQCRTSATRCDALWTPQIGSVYWVKQVVARALKARRRSS